MVFVAFGAGYLLGSLPFAWLFGRLAGADIRRTGSGNVGTANVEPVAGYPAAVVVFFLDVGKALLAVLIGSRWGPAGQVAAGWGVIAGHSWPVWLRFVGGRGQAVALAAGGAIAPWATLSILPVLGIGMFTRNLALSWPVALLAWPPLALFFHERPGALFALGAGLLAVVRRLQGSPLLGRLPLREAWRSRLLYDREP